MLYNGPQLFYLLLRVSYRLTEETALLVEDPIESVATDLENFTSSLSIQTTLESS